MRLSWGECKNGEYHPQPSYNRKHCGHKIFKANQIAWFFYTKFQHHDQHQNQHHDWNLLNKFWLLITFGVLSKVSLKVKVKLCKIQNNSSINMQTWKCQFQSHIHTLYIFLIHFLLLIIIYILFKLAMPDEKNLKTGFCLYFYIF